MSPFYGAGRPAARFLAAIARLPRFLGYGVTLDQRADGPGNVPPAPPGEVGRVAAAAAGVPVTTGAAPSSLEAGIYRSRVEWFARSYVDGRRANLDASAGTSDELGDYVIVLGARIAQLCQIDSAELNLPPGMRRAVSLFGKVPGGMDVLLAPDPADPRNGGPYTPVIVHGVDLPGVIE